MNLPLVNVQLAGEVVARGAKVTKDVANMLPNICNPAYLWQQAQELPASTTASLLKSLMKLKWQSLVCKRIWLLVVAHNESMMSIMHHRGGPADQAPIVL